MSVTLDYAKRQLRYWQRVVRELRQTKREEKRLTRQREKKGREKISPTPPLKREGERKENASSSSSARVCVRNINQHPTLDAVLRFAEEHDIDEAFARSWHERMCHVYHWRHPKKGNNIVVWPRYLQLWWERREEFDPLPVATESKQITINTKGLDAL